MANNYDDEAEESGLEPTPESLGRWLEEQYLGDDRFEAVEIDAPGQLEGEAVRVRFVATPTAHFFVSVLEDDGLVRVGLATEEQDLSETIESEASENGSSLSEFMADIMDAEGELEHEVQHFHDDVYYFCSEIPYQREEDLASEHLRDEVVYYLDGYLTAFYDYVNPTDDDEDEDDE